MSELPAFVVDGPLANMLQSCLFLFNSIRQYLLEHIDVFAPIGILQIVIISWICAAIFMTAFLFALRRIVKSIRSKRSRSSRRRHDYDYDLEMCEGGNCREHGTQAIPVYVRLGRERSLSVGSAGIARKSGQQFQFGMLVPVMVDGRAHGD
ncbi:hypothetical protein V5O48_009730 [Marasmius crinis-equi]|uniref:Uncharacterized protein n=1 Tax=Marasmius crinis-equi TaxID=585013 RepID=A0ABR3FA83_9AGAR